MAARRILQIVPAPGWFAVCILVEEPWYELAPLALWALVDDGIQRYVSGLDVRMDLCDSSPSFLEYVHESQITDELHRYWEALGSDRGDRATVRA